MTRTFRPPLWAVALTVLATLACGSLGAWQLHRGVAKQRMLDALAEHRVPALALTAATPAPAALAPQAAQARGVWRGDRQLLEDGQSRDGMPGFHVWTPLQLADGLVLVNRGWVPNPPPELAAPAGPAEVSGWWTRLPEPALRLEARTACAPAQKFPAVVLYPRAAELDCLLGEHVAAGLLLLDPGAPGGFVREWTFARIPPARHYGYAVQWFGLAALAVGLFIKLNLKRSP